jgi:hypothetical protein
MKIDNVRYETQCESEVTWILSEITMVPIKVDKKSLQEKLDHWPITFKDISLGRHVTEQDIKDLQNKLALIANNPFLTTAPVNGPGI